MSILANLDRRVNRRTVKREVRQHVRHAREIVFAERRAAKERYAGGLPAEKTSLAVMLDSLHKRALVQRQEVRRSVLRRCGRRIHLGQLMAERRADGSPAWAIVSPNQPIGPNLNNGLHDTNGSVYWHAPHYDVWLKLYEGAPNLAKSFKPVGMPALPPTVRTLCSDKTILRRAKRIGILYQPEAWVEVRPDPALVVEWADLPGEYYALAVWGVDGPRIMEFVD